MYEKHVGDSRVNGYARDAVVEVRRTSTAQNRVAAALARLDTMPINDDGRETVHVDSEEAKGALLCVIDGVPRWAVVSALDLRVRWSRTQNLIRRRPSYLGSKRFLQWYAMALEGNYQVFRRRREDVYLACNDRSGAG